LSEVIYQTFEIYFFQPKCGPREKNYKIGGLRGDNYSCQIINICALGSAGPEKRWSLEKGK
jgi:hypothetical protein